MNKAFLREPDSTEVLCPQCRAAGVEVPRSTAEAHLSAEALRPLAATAYFCETPSCQVAYFDAFEARATTDQLRGAVYPKDADAPLCPCFGLTKTDVADDVAEGVPRRIRELLAKSKSPLAHCDTASPTGRCCMTEVQRYYFKLRET
jgi:hypothetical protein